MIVHEGHTRAAYSVAFSPDGKSVVSGSLDQTIRMWNAHRPSQIGDPLRGHSGSIYSVSYSPLGNTIASASYDKTIRLWDVKSLQQLGQPIQGNHSFYSIAFSPSAQLIASSYTLGNNPDRCTVQLWNVEKKKSASNPFKGHIEDVNSVQFSPDGSQIVSGSDDRTILVWDVERGMAILRPFQGHTGFVTSIALSPSGSQIVSGSSDRTLRLWDTRTEGMIGNLFEGHTDFVHSVDFSPRGTYVVSGSDDMTVRLWDIRTGRQVESFHEHAKSVRNIAAAYPDSADSSASRIITSQMSTQQMFDCLIASGCIDLSSQMDTQQDAAMIVSGGGFGDIWKGQLHNGAKVAIKAWRTNAMGKCDYKTLKRAARELFLWSGMDHPNIHRLQGVIMLRDFYLGMVSEWMDNGNLHEYLLKSPDADRYQLCVDVASGLEYMHSRSMVHGDLKAANVLVSSDGVAKISDFDFSVMSGVTSLVFSQTSNSRSGSLRWMAPELLLEEAHERTTQSDVYALGMTMLEIFTEDVPYPDRRADIGVIRAVDRGTLPTRPMEQLGDNQKGNMMWSLLMRCWARKCGARPSSAQVVETVSGWLSSKLFADEIANSYCLV
ncbi:putative WD repeat-containing protein alr3466 [Nostoc sp, PCC 7120] [Rhizoctonia solani]|uniref:Putative WD repeat-containing protein alr3466 [Nostoc sp, PCC 7120] n=1 Tax=Rhizoctonia solani TaxID=456999 RepID=A0A0K6G4C1_9AGAM|nr:putative WD repeat-containing protein alr3466 [Nostoc sp, PCC 7120] [Rhizoctonia solani]